MKIRPRLLASLSCALTAAALLAAEGTVGGIRWTVPTGWVAQADRPMRVATYSIPAAPGSEVGECGVYYFGKGQGGGVEENIRRWSQQFQGTPRPVLTDRTVAGLRVHLVTIAGTYLSPSGPMMQSEGARPHYRLLGAIVEAPGGLVFFKCVGPDVTITAAQKSFDALVASLGKAATSV